MRMKGFAIPLALIFALVTTACGGDDGGGDGVDVDEASPTTETVTGATGATAGTETGTTGATGTDDVAVGGEVPDPCSLITAEQLGGILGSDPGAGTVQAVVPDQRKVCFYDTGLILAVEVAENWEASIAILRDSGTGSVTDVSGIGESAIWQDVGGGVGQLLALGPDYFVGVTVVAGGQSAGEQVAEIMLQAL